MRPVSFLLAGAAFLTLAAAPAVQAQNYRPFGPGRTYHYRETASVAGAADTVLLFKVDSVGVAGTDSVFYFNRTVALPMMSSKRINLFGGWMRWDAATGTATFGAQDTAATLEIRTRGPLNQPWPFSSSGLTAQLTSRSVGRFLGVLDTLLSVRISDGRTLLLSRKVGLIDGTNLDFYLGQSYATPLRRRDLVLAAVPEIQANPVQDITWDNIWDLQPGDRLFYRTSSQFTSTAMPTVNSSASGTEVHHITQRTVSPGGDTITLTSTDTISTTTYPNATWSGVGTTTYQTRTRVETQMRWTLRFLTYSRTVSPYAVELEPALQYADTFEGRPIIKYMGPFQVRTSRQYFAAPGLGEVVKHDNNYTTQTDNLNTIRLIGYIKNDGTSWGNTQVPQPLAVPNDIERLPATLAPNPAPAGGAPALYFTLEQPQAVALTLYDALGRVIWQQNAALAAGAQRLTVAAATPLAPGLYRLRLTLADGRQRLLPLVRE